MKVLILGGGGTLGAFSAGALEVLHEAGYRPDAMIGSSAGAINLLRYVVDGKEGPCEFWRGIGLRTIARHALTHNVLKDGILDPTRFRARVERGVDWQRLKDDARALSVIVLTLGTGAVRVRGNRTEKTPTELRAVARGAYALPPLLPPVACDGELLSDGGLLHNAPLQSAAKLGATQIVYLCNVHVLPQAGFVRPNALRSTLRYAEVFFRRASNVGFADAELVDDTYRGIPFVAVAPPSALRFGALLRWMLPTVDAMEHLIASGRAAAQRALTQTRRSSLLAR